MKRFNPKKLAAMLAVGMCLVVAFTVIGKKNVSAQGGGSQKIVVVSVGSNGYPSVSPDFILIDRTLGETVLWQARPGVNFTVSFDGNNSPFQNSHFSNGSPASGAIRTGALGTDYKYSVEVNGKVIDPKVGVRPPG